MPPVGPADRRRRDSVWTELLTQQVPIVVGVFAAGVAASYLQHGTLVGGAGRPFPLAGISVPLWHLLWLGFWTGYTMALVGQGTGIFALPYMMSILRFDSLAVTPTNLVITAVNPVGALLGFRRRGQWNVDFALPACVGSVLGSTLGPFVRVLYLRDPAPFKAMVGLALVWLGAHLVWQITPWYLRARDHERRFAERFRERARAEAAAGRMPSGIPDDARIVTVDRSWRRLRIRFLDQEWTLNPIFLTVLGAVVGFIGSAFGVGGAFLLVPLLMTLFRMPIYVIVAATIPFVIVQSLTGLLSFLFVVPALTGLSSPPEWSLAFYVAAPAVLGAWLAAKTQHSVPGTYLTVIAGLITGVGGLLYVANVFVALPFRI